VELSAGLDTYSPSVGALAAAIVRRMESPSDWHTDHADTVAIADLVQASFASAAVMALSEPDATILLQLPSYPPCMRAIEDTSAY
jgi:bifunctional pyridoxal-dependent enzyme with beta-cystathionase and maltose regulon repressor activities